MMHNSIIKSLHEKINNSASHKTKTPEQIDNDIHESNIKGVNQIRWLRWALASVIVIIALAHLGVLYWFINKNGENNISHNLSFISDKVMLMFMGTTTVDVFGLLFILIKFLFPNYQN